MKDLLLLALIPVSLSVVCFVIGHLLCMASGRFFSVGERIIIGYIICTAVFQIIAVPFMYFALDFLPLYYICIALIVLCILVAAFCVFRCNKYKIKSIPGMVANNHVDKKDIYLWGILIIGIAFQIIYVVLHQHTDIDDSFYIAETNTILETGKVLGIDPASGLAAFPFPSTYKLVGYEVLLAVIVKVFHINAAYLCHTVLPAFLIFLHYLIVINIAKRLDRDNAVYFILLYQIVNLFSGYSGYSQGAFLLYRIWQGKAVMINVVIPALILTFLWIYLQKKISWKLLLYITAVLISGFHTTTVAIYLVPIAYFGLAAGHMFVQKKIYDSMKLCVPVLFVLPFVGLKLYVSLTADMSSGSGEQINLVTSVGKGASSLSYVNELIIKYMNGHVFLLFLIVLSLLLICVRGNRKERGIVGIPAIVLGCTFCNPLLAEEVARYVTGSSVYWRLFWLFEFPLILVTAIVIVVRRISEKKSYGILSAAGVIVIVVLGVNIFNEDGFVNRENKYKLDSVSVTIADMILDDTESYIDKKEETVLLMPMEISFGVREYTGKISLIVNRYAEGTFAANGEKEKWERLDNRLIQPLYGTKEINENLVDELNYFDIDYVVLFEDSLKEDKSIDGLDYIGDCANYSVYRIENN